MPPRAVGTILLLFLACAWVTVKLEAEDITTNDGRVFKNATVVKFDADGVVIRHDGGTKQVAWSELPAPLRQRYQSEARRQKEVEIQKLKQDLARAEAEAAKLNLSEARTAAATNLPAVAPVNESNSSIPRASTLGKPPGDRAALKPEEIVDAADLIAQFKTDSAAAEKSFQKKTFRVKGVVQRFESKLFLRQYGVVLESPEQFMRVVLRFDYPDDYKSIYTIQNGQKLVGHPARREEVTLMTVGDLVVIQGKCNGLRDAEIVFTGCKVVH